MVSSSAVEKASIRLDDLKRRYSEATGKAKENLATQVQLAQIAYGEATQGKITGTASALQQMGIATKDATGQYRGTIDVLADVADYYANASDKTQALALVTKVLGKGYMTPLPILAGGKANIEEITASAEKNGLVLSQDSVDAIAKYKSATMDAAEAQKGMSVQLGLAILPIKTLIMDGIAKLFGWYNKLSPATKKLITYVGLAATAFALIGGPILILISILPMLSAGIGLVSAAMNAAMIGPIGLIVLAIAAVVAIVILCIKYHKQLGAALTAAWHAIEAGARAFARGVTAAFWAVIHFITGIPSKILEEFKNAGKWLYDVGRKIITGLWDGMKAVFWDVVHWGEGLYDKITGWIHFSGGPLYEVGQKTMSGFAAGLQSNLHLARGVVAKSMSGLSVTGGSFAMGAVSGSFAGGPSGGSGGATVKHEHHIYLDGRELNRALGKTIVHSERSGGA